ncbi:Symporter with substrate-binding domain [hydrothermal vent metagenome]|uniref:Symporter with substrate-binding domain n=1 Tax=hydrothermal vent metagenome TaxID=652676 RepID=A0A3B0XM27_9ZZZZ
MKFRTKRPFQLLTHTYNRMSPFQRVIIALFLGIFSGIFIGEPAGQLEIIGNVYIRLLQMTVLPYVLVSIIGGLGRLDSDMASSIGLRAIKVILVMWLSVMLTLIILPLAYPNWETAGFFSTSLIAESVKFNFIDLYIPSNIFSSLAGTVVPAVVLFSLLMGIALIKVKNKETLLSLTHNIGDSLMGVASYVAKLAPLGIFAISISAAGTLQLEELGRLQIFLWVYLTAAALLAFVFLPLLIHWATPFSYREVLSTAGEAAITALATGTVLVVLPMIAERCKELLEKKQMSCNETRSTVDVLVPTAYSFPSTGTLLGLGFILFSAWYVGSPLSIDQYPSFIVMGALTAFGSMAVAIPFLLDYFGLPADQFQLYLLGSVITARFATGLAALHGFVITLLVASAVLKKLKWHRLFQAIGIHLGVTAGVITLLGLALTHLIPYEYTGVRTFESMRLMDHPVEVKEIKEPTPLSADDQLRHRLKIINERGTLRVGYYANTLPYAFRNNKNEIVGYDMEMIHALAHDLNLTLELIHLSDYSLESQLLNDGSLDITIGGRAVTPVRATQIAYSHSYAHHTAGFVVADSRRDQFSELSAIKSMKNLRLGVVDSHYYKKSVKKMFPNAKIVIIESPREFFRGYYKDRVDAFVTSTESGSAWSMLYPAYTALIPKGLKVKSPISLPLPVNQADYVRFINTWLQLKKDNGFQAKVYDYWILGKNPKARKPRWSIMHNVLGWY